MDQILNAQAGAIRDIIAAVPNSGVALDHQPNPAPPNYAAMVKTFTAMIGTKRQIRAWTVQYVGEERVRRTVALGNTKTTRHARWIVRAHVSWNDADVPDSEFRDLLELVVKALDTNLSLNGTAYDHTPVQVALPNNGEAVLLGDYFCRYAELTFTSQIEQTLATN